MLIIFAKINCRIIIKFRCSQYFEMMRPLLETCQDCFLEKHKSKTYIEICTCCWSKESFSFARGQERMEFFYAKVNSRNSDISLSASCPRILVQLAVGQKQINLMRKREAVFTGNHAATAREGVWPDWLDKRSSRDKSEQCARVTHSPLAAYCRMFGGRNFPKISQTKRDKERRKFLSAKESVANAPSMRPHPRASGQAAGPDSSYRSGRRRNRIQWGTIVIYLPRRVLAPVQRPTWPRLFIKSVPNRAPCWALTRPVSRRCAIRNGKPLFHEQQVKRTRCLANDIDSAM